MLTINKETKFKETQTCGKNNSVALGCSPCTTFFFLPHFEVIFDSKPNRRTEICKYGNILPSKSYHNGDRLALSV